MQKHCLVHFQCDRDVRIGEGWGARDDVDMTFSLSLHSYTHTHTHSLSLSLAPSRHNRDQQSPINPYLQEPSGDDRPRAYHSRRQVSAFNTTRRSPGFDFKKRTISPPAFIFSSVSLSAFPPPSPFFFPRSIAARAKRRYDCDFKKVLAVE